MRRAKIIQGEFYEVALDRSGRGGRRILERDFIKVVSVEEDGRSWDIRYVVIGQRALTKGVVLCRFATRDVLRPATNEEAEKWAGYLKLSKNHGWIFEGPPLDQ